MLSLHSTFTHNLCRLLTGLLCLLSIVSSIGILSAQNLRIEGGLSSSNLRLSTTQGSYTGNTRFGYRIGLGYEFRIKKIWHCAPMLVIKSHGAELNLQQNTLEIAHSPSTTIRQSTSGNTPYIQGHQVMLPIYMGIRTNPIARWLNIRLEAGPYIGYTFSNKLFVSQHALDLMSLKGPTGGYAQSNPWDYGVSGSVALGIRQVYLKVGLEYGLSNQIKFDNRNTSDNPQLTKLLEQYPKLSEIGVEALSRTKVNHLNFHFSLGITL